MLAQGDVVYAALHRTRPYTGDEHIAPRRCDNPDCDNVVPGIRVRDIRFGKNRFCSLQCKSEFFLWVEAAARQRPGISVRPPRWAMRISLSRP